MHQGPTRPTLIAQHKLLVLGLLFVLTSVSIAIAYAADWYYFIKEKERLLTFNTWSWTGMRVRKYAANILISDDFITWFDAGFPSVATIFNGSFYMVTVGAALNGILGLQLLSIMLLRNRNQFCTPRQAKLAICITSILSFLTLTLGCLQFLGTMGALRKDQLKEFHGIPCVLLGPCFSFLGTNEAEELREWGPLHGWAASLAAAGFTLIASIYALLLRAPKRSDYYQNI